MGAEDLGIVAFGMAYVGLFAFISELGFSTAHIKRLSEGKDLGKCTGTFLVIKLVLTAFMVISVILSIFIWEYGFGRGYETLEHRTSIYIFILYYVVISISGVPLATFSARRETAKQQISALIEPSTRVPLTILVALGSFGVFALAGAYLIGMVASLLTALILFIGYPVGKFDKETYKSYYRFAIPIALASSISVISVNIDKVFLQLFYNATVVGYYFTVQRVTIFMISISTALVVLLFPTLSKHHTQNNHAEIRRLTLTSERYISLIILPFAILLIIFAQPILYLFDKDVAENATTVLQIMTIYSIVISFMTIFSYQIIAIDRPKIAVKIGVSMALINIFLNIILIPKDIKILGLTLFGLGAEGAALATTISAIYGLIASKIITRKLTGTKWNSRILLHLIAAVIMGIALFSISDIFSIWDMFNPLWAGIVELLLYIGLLIFMGLLGVGIYLGILIIFKEFKKDDLRFFLSILNPREMKDYIASELRGKKKRK